MTQGLNINTKAVYCTHTGAEHFAYYKTTASKSRENFLRILLQGKEGYIINEAFIWHLFQAGVEDDLLNRLEEYVGRRYQSKKGFNRLLNEFGIGNKKLRMQCIEAGVVGFISETILRSGQVLLSDRAGQFALFNHAACWVHMERPLRKLKVSSLKIERELEDVDTNLIIHLAQNLKDIDVSRLALLLTELDRIHHQAVPERFPLFSLEKRKEDIRKMIDQGYIFCAEINSEIIGFASVLKRKGALMIEHLYVQPNVRHIPFVSEILDA